MNPAFWDNRYRFYPSAYGDEPNHYLVQNLSLFKSGMKVLALGEGEGRNALWLAEHQCEVWMIDFSRVGLKKASEIARKNELNMKFICAELSEWYWPIEYFDAVFAIFLHLPPIVRSQVHLSILQTLKTNGTLMMQTFHKDQLNFATGGPKSEEMLYTAEMLHQDFQSSKILNLEETVVQLNEGSFHNGPAAVINLTLQKN